MIDSMVRCYHEYKSVWENPVHGKELNCTRELRRLEILTILWQLPITEEIGDVIVTVGHVSRRISALHSKN